MSAFFMAISWRMVSTNARKLALLCDVAPCASHAHTQHNKNISATDAVAKKVMSHSLGIPILLYFLYIPQRNATPRASVIGKEDECRHRRNGNELVGRHRCNQHVPLVQPSLAINDAAAKVRQHLIEHFFQKRASHLRLNAAVFDSRRLNTQPHGLQLIHGAWRAAFV